MYQVGFCVPKPEQLYTMFVHCTFEVKDVVFGLVLALMQPEGHHDVKLTCKCNS